MPPLALRSLPLWIRINARRPRKADASRLVTSACSGASGSPLGGGMCSEQNAEQRVEVLARRFSPLAGWVVLAMPARPDAYQRGQIERFLGGGLRLLVEVGGDVEQQVVAFVDDFVDAGVGPVGLVDHQDHRQVRGQCLAEHEAGLRQRPLGGVDQQQDPVDHGQPTLDLAAEVGVPEVSITLITVIPPSAWRRCTAVFLARIVIPFSFSGHRSPSAARRVVTAVAQGTRLAQHGVDQRGLAVVDVRHDGDVAEVMPGSGEVTPVIVSACDPVCENGEARPAPPPEAQCAHERAGIGQPLVLGDPVAPARTLRPPRARRQRSQPY